MKSLTNNNLIKSAIINGIILVTVMVFTSLVYETNDDYSMALRIDGNYPYCTFVNYFLCKILIALQNLIPAVNVFVLFQIVMSWVSFTVITAILMERCKEHKAFLIIAVLILSIFAGDHYSIVQFTKTSALMLTAGFLLLVDSILERRRPWFFAGAFLLIFLGAWLRFMNLMVAIGAAGLFAFFYVLTDMRRAKEDGLFARRQLGIYGICIVLLAGLLGTQVLSSKINEGSQELKDFNSYDIKRSSVTDYPVYSSYEEHGDEYEAIGISENDLFLIDHWYLDYNGAASEENLDAILNIYNKGEGEDRSITKAVRAFVRETLKEFDYNNKRAVHIKLMIALAILAVLILKPRHWLYILAAGFYAAVIYIYLYYLGRPLYRATYIADLGTVVWILYYLSERSHLRDGINSFFAEKKSLALKGVLCIICALAVLQWQVPGIKTSERLARIEADSRISQEMENYIAAHDDKFFVFGIGSRGTSPYFSEPLKLPPKGYQKNCLGFGSWGTKSPYIFDKLQVYGMENTFGDIIDNPDVYVFEDRNEDRLEEYFNKWYGDEKGHITLVPAGKVGDHDLWQVKSKI